MQAGLPDGLTPPEGLRPAQLGVVLLGKVILGHASATLVDLAQRGFLSIDEAGDGIRQDWLLTDLRGQAAGSRPLGFEAALLDGLFSERPAVHLSKVGDELAPALDRFRAQLRRDAIRHGWLRRWRRGQRRPGGEKLLRQILIFRRQLRALIATGDARALERMAPYAMIFGLGPSTVNLTDASGAGAAPDRRSEVPWSRSDRFARSWLAACTGFSVSGRKNHSRPTQSGDFVHQWSAQHDHHSHPTHGHSSGFGGGYGDHGGGHHGGFDGAGHSGF